MSQAFSADDTTNLAQRHGSAAQTSSGEGERSSNRHAEMSTPAVGMRQRAEINQRMADISDGGTFWKQPINVLGHWGIQISSISEIRFLLILPVPALSKKP